MMIMRVWFVSFGSFNDMQHHTKNKKCFVCNQPTMGIFNAAHEIKKRMAEERSKAQGL